MWREYARVHKGVSSLCMVELQCVGGAGARFRNCGFFPYARGLFSYICIVPAVEGEIIVLDWPEDLIIVWAGDIVIPFCMIRIFEGILPSVRR